MQPVTIMFKVGGVDTARAPLPGSFETTVDTAKGELQALAREKLPHPAGHVLLYETTLPGVITCNMTNCTDINGLRAEDLTRGTAVCRSQIQPIVMFLREYVPGFEHCYALSSASLLGVRETRHFHGRYTLTREDILEKRVFEDWIVRDACFNFDVHNIDGAGLDKTGVQKHFPKHNSYTIPYRCLLPQNVEGLLLAGRDISGSHMAHSNYRAMPICVAMGEAAGIAAALASRANIPVSAAPVGEIQRILRSGAAEQAGTMARWFCGGKWQPLCGWFISRHVVCAVAALAGDFGLFLSACKFCAILQSLATVLRLTFRLNFRIMKTTPRQI